MARRKSLIVSMYESHQKAKAARERERLRAEREAGKLYQQELRRERSEQQSRAAAQQQAAKEAAADAERARTARDRQLRQEAAAKEKRDRAAAVARRVRQADRQSALLARRRDQLESVLADRSKGLHAQAPNIERAFNEAGPQEMARLIAGFLNASSYPDGVSVPAQVATQPESRELLIEMELPSQQVVPRVQAYRYVKTKDEVRPEPVKDVEVKKAYGRLLSRLVLRVLAEAFDATPATLVQTITINAYVAAHDRATGQPIRPCLLSVSADRDAFDGVVLDQPELDPELCLRHFFNAIVSPHPYDLEPVRPVLTFDLSRYRLVEEMDVAAGLDSRVDLLTLKPVEFEHLIRELFEAIGLKSWVTQSSRDEGADGVAVNEDPIVGGLCIIQAKRYSNIVGLEAVNALAGVMDDKAAAKGVLVTTSWVGKASRDFATRNGRIEIIEGRHLKALLREHLGIDVLIGLPKLPLGWAREEIS